VPTIIGKVQAVDRDEGENAITRYRITNDSSLPSNFNETVIAVNETTGELYSIGSLDKGSVRDFTEYVGGRSIVSVVINQLLFADTLIRDSFLSNLFTTGITNLEDKVFFF
jgi:hypothetical protein